MGKEGGSLMLLPLLWETKEEVRSVVRDEGGCMICGCGRRVKGAVYVGNGRECCIHVTKGSVSG